MTKFIHSLWRRRWLRVCVWILVAWIAAIVSIRQYIDWSGARKWAAVQALIARDGESLDIRKTAPPDVPDDQNFCAIPALKDLPLWHNDENDKSELGLKGKRLMDAGLPWGKLSDSSNFIPRPKAFKGAVMGERTDMAAWANWFRRMRLLPSAQGSVEPARQVSAAMSKSDALVLELEQGLDRPYSQWAPSLRTRPLPEPLSAMRFDYFELIEGMVPALCLRSIASARAGDIGQAHNSLLVAMRLVQATMKEPTLISALVSVGSSYDVSAVTWELCAGHTGTSEQFGRLQVELEQLDLRECLLQAERSEMAFDADSGRFEARSNAWGHFSAGSDMNPRGWMGANLATLEQWELEYAVEPLRDKGLKELLQKQNDLEVLMKSIAGHPLLHGYNVLVLLAASPWKGIAEKAIYAQCLLNEAIAACALERYRIEHGSYPDTLEAANHPGEPAIPVDVISGQPMHYRKTPNGMYALWCVGFDGKDDGGKRVLDPSRPDHTQFTSPDYKGDWVWDFSGESGRFK